MIRFSAICVINAVVTIGFSQTVYSVPEEDGSGEGSMVEVCLDVFSGHIDRTVIVTMSAADGSATGMFILNTVGFCLLIMIIVPLYGIQRPSFRPEARVS